ncbi:MAG: YcxB family protein [Bacteroidota bacterium]
MIIKTKISFKEYCSLLFKLTYKRTVLKIIVCVGLAMIVWIPGYYFHLLPVPKPEIYQYITLTLIAVVQPISIYWLIKRNYDSNNHLGEELEIKVTSAEIYIRGNSFYTELIWKNIFKVDEETNYILIYQNSLSAIIISKKDMTQKEVQELKEILAGIPNVPVKLKENT